jgi:DNA polymerase-3 subunit delta'
VLAVPARLTGPGPAFAAAAALVKAAETEAAAITEELDTPEREALRRAFGEGSTGKGVAKAVRGSAGAMRELAVQLGARAELASAGHERDVRKLAGASRPEATVRRIEAVMACRERLELSVAPLLAVEEMTLALAARR